MVSFKRNRRFSGPPIDYRAAHRTSSMAAIKRCVCDKDARRHSDAAGTARFASSGRAGRCLARGRPRAPGPYGLPSARARSSRHSASSADPTVGRLHRAVPSMRPSRPRYARRYARSSIAATAADGGGHVDAVDRHRIPQRIKRLRLRRAGGRGAGRRVHRPSRTCGRR